jgi:hypothetical protein
MEDKFFTQRITVSIGIVATYLTLLLNIDSILGFPSNNFTRYIKIIIYVFLGIIFLQFFLYLLFEAKKFKFALTDKRIVNDFSFFFIYVMLYFFGRKYLSYSNNKEELIKSLKKNNYKYFYDSGVNNSFRFPFLILAYLILQYINYIFQKFSFKPYIEGIILIGVLSIIFIIPFLLKRFREKVTGS